MKRFYKAVSVEAADGGWQVRLDGRGVRTAGKRPQVVPHEALARAMAAEWAGQGEEIDPSAFLFRDMADYAIDVIAPDPQVAISAIMPYAGTDTLCYRDVEGSALFRRQVARWEPLLAAAEARYDVRFERASGIIHQPQPSETLDRMERVVTAHGPSRSPPCRR